MELDPQCKQGWQLTMPVFLLLAGVMCVSCLSQSWKQLCPMLAGRALQLSDLPEECPGTVQGLVSVSRCLGGYAVPLHYEHMKLCLFVRRFLKKQTGFFLFSYLLCIYFGNASSYV